MKTKLFHYRWDAPTKNPNAVDGYRIFYHEAAVLPPTSSSGSGSSAPSSDQGSAMENTGMDTLAAMNNATSMGGGSNNAMAALEIRRIDVKDTTISINGLPLADGGGPQRHLDAAHLAAARVRPSA